jgi:uncharacterized protein YuzE
MTDQRTCPTCHTEERDMPNLGNYTKHYGWISDGEGIEICRDSWHDAAPPAPIQYSQESEIERIQIRLDETAAPPAQPAPLARQKHYKVVERLLAASQERPPSPEKVATTGQRFTFGRWIVEFDGEADAAYIYTNGKIPDGGVAFTNELVDGPEQINADYDKDGKLLGIEIIL